MHAFRKPAYYIKKMELLLKNGFWKTKFNFYFTFLPAGWQSQLGKIVKTGLQAPCGT